MSGLKKRNRKLEDLKKKKKKEKMHKERSSYERKGSQIEEKEGRKKKIIREAKNEFIKNEGQKLRKKKLAVYTKGKKIMEVRSKE